MDRESFDGCIPECNAGFDAGPGARTRGLSRRALARAQAFMQDRLGERITLEDVAGAACVSRAHFARMFRLSTGTTPMAYLMQLRVERAKVLIANGSRPICDIAIALGFCDQSHFSRVFRRATGLPPKSYARMQA